MATEQDPRDFQPRAPGRVFYLGWVVLVAIVLAGTAGLVAARDRWLRRITAARSQEVARGQRVLVKQVEASPQSRSLDLPGEIHGYVETPVFAKIPGYLKSIRVDKGDRVKQGDVIATLISPETDQQVANALAGYKLALITDRRNRALLREGVIAKQTADDSHAAMLQAKASYEQVAATLAYTVIKAPFSGVVTARYVDPGKLIPQSTGGTTVETPIVAMATLTPVRVYSNVPQSVAPFIKDGDPAIVTVTDYPQRLFEGAVTRHPSALDQATRTMLVEIDLPNSDLALFPGMYARVQFQVAIETTVPIVPDDALIFRDGKPYVPVVNGTRLHLAPVELGYDDGINIQIRRGIAVGDLIAVNVGQSAREGETVQPVREAAN
jgi:membrane fusion protein (multidrug efflux system)